MYPFCISAYILNFLSYVHPFTFFILPLWRFHNETARPHTPSRSLRGRTYPMVHCWLLTVTVLLIRFNDLALPTSFIFCSCFCCCHLTSHFSHSQTVRWVDMKPKICSKNNFTCGHINDSQSVWDLKNISTTEIFTFHEVYCFTYGLPA